MIAIQPAFLTESERNDLRTIVRRNYERSQITRHANIILLLDLGKKAKEIADFLFLDAARFTIGRFNFEMRQFNYPFS